VQWPVLVVRLGEREKDDDVACSNWSEFLVKDHATYKL